MKKAVLDWNKFGWRESIVIVVLAGFVAFIIIYFFFQVDFSTSRKRVAEFNALATRFKNGEPINLKVLQKFLAKEGYNTFRTPLDANDRLKCACDSRWYGLTGRTRNYFNKDHDVVVVFDVKNDAVINIEILQHAE